MDVVKALTANRKVRLVGVPTSAWAWAVSDLAHRQEVVVVVAPEASGVEALAEGLRTLLGTVEVLVLPAWDVQPYDRVGPSVEVVGQRQRVLAALHGHEEDEHLVVVTSVAALGVRDAPVSEGMLVLRVREGFEFKKIANELSARGYVREEMVQEAVCFAIRGGIVDVWPAGESEPVRLEFFGDEIESVRVFDPSTQKTLEAHNEVSIAAVSGTVLDGARMETFRTKYRAAFPDGMGDEVYEAVSSGMSVPEAGQLLPLFFEEDLPDVLSVLPEAALLVVPDTLQVQAESWEELVQGAYAARRDAGGVRAVHPQDLFVPASELLGTVGKFRQLELAAFDDGNGENPGLRAHAFGASNRHDAAVKAAKEVTARVAEGWSVMLTAVNEAALAQFMRALEGEGVPLPRLLERFEVVRGQLVASVSGLQGGWVDAPHKVLVLAESDVFGARVGSGTRRRKRSAEEMIAHFSELREGDYVVHEEHGIGRFGGLLTLEVGQAPATRQDFLKLFYADEDRLFVPVENLDVLSRYKGAEAGVVTLDKLGTGGWQARKEQVKEDLMIMAGELLATAAARELVTRTPVDKGVGLYDEFCAGFPHPLTEDQERVMEEVEMDFAAGTPMDRLVVGDVGFGKTEVALRAAFLMAASGRQVAIVCPTTLLARQHFAVFSERFNGFPMKVGRLSRLVSATETRETKQAMAKGTMDIVIGTHALLSKDIAFARLGLVVIDEEQRFGVVHKERLKELRAETDILTLTATPIPRTLQMAVGGVRQLSLITTPPVDRQAVQTFILRWDNVTLKGAITRELVRGGQVYVVAPHVEDLAVLEDDLRNLAPEAKVGVAHGQMNETRLEEVMGQFYEGKLDVLLATTIIESGLDVPRANTLIVYRADRFGLAQLYQLRGRVGRSTARAYAYFLLPEGPLGSEAGKRLNILQRLEGLGAGFQLASYDMDLRGFGNLLGKQQSGNIRDIGFELYARMLKEAVETRQKRGAVVQAENEELVASTVTLKLGISYLIPEAYVPDVALRLQLYRRLAHVETVEGLEEFRAELKDRFGPLPDEVRALLEVVSLRNRAAALNVSKIEVGEKGVVVVFEDGKFIQPAGLMKHITELAGVITVRPDMSLVWHRRLGRDVLRGVGVIITELEEAGGLVPVAAVA